MATGKVNQFVYGEGTFLEEHIFVPDLQNTGNPVDTGWPIGLHHIISASTTQLSEFNAFQLSDGPITTARLSQAMPPGCTAALPRPKLKGTNGSKTGKSLERKTAISRAVRR